MLVITTIYRNLFPPCLIKPDLLLPPHYQGHWTLSHGETQQNVELQVESFDEHFLNHCFQRLAQRCDGLDREEDGLEVGRRNNFV